MLKPLFYVLLAIFTLTLFSCESDESEKLNNQNKNNPFPNDGQMDAFIDNYTIALIAAAVLIIAYVVYTKRQSKLA